MPGRLNEAHMDATGEYSKNSLWDVHENERIRPGPSPALGPYMEGTSLKCYSRFKKAGVAAYNMLHHPVIRSRMMELYDTMVRSIPIENS